MKPVSQSDSQHYTTYQLNPTYIKSNTCNVTELPTIFTYENREVKTIEKNGEPWFVAKDICDVLEVRNPSDALSRLDDEEKSSIILNDRTSSGGNPNVAIINESGMYSLVLSSRKPEAKVFKKWVPNSVLPSIRKAMKQVLILLASKPYQYQLPNQEIPSLATCNTSSIQVKTTIRVDVTDQGQANPCL